jgi:hypothetical protein
MPLEWRTQAGAVGNPFTEEEITGVVYEVREEGEERWRVPSPADWVRLGAVPKAVLAVHAPSGVFLPELVWDLPEEMRKLGASGVVP